MGKNPFSFNRSRKLLLSLKDDESGVVLIVGAVVIPILLFATGLVVDSANWYQQRAKAQYAAHFAAAAGAQVLGTQGGTLNAAIKTATAVAAKNGFSTGVTADQPKNFQNAMGNYLDASSHPYALEVRISPQRANAFGTLFANATTSMPVRAVADYTAVNPCIMVLNTGTGVSSGVNLNGTNASLIVPCGLYINSKDSSRSLNANTGTNTVCASTTDVNLLGVISMGGDSTGNYRSGLCPGIKTIPNQPPIVNPYAYLSAVPPAAISGTATPVSSFSYTITKSGTSTTYTDGAIASDGQASTPKKCTGASCTISYRFTPGYYPNGLNIISADSVTFDNGNFNIAGEGLGISGATATLGTGDYYLGSASVVCDTKHTTGSAINGLSLSSSTVTTATFSSVSTPDNGTTIFLPNSDCGRIFLTSSTLNLNAPTANATTGPRNPGFAVVQAPPSVTGNSVPAGTQSSTSIFNVYGLVIMPNADLILRGGNSSTYSQFSSTSCSGFVVWTLGISGNSNVVNGCKNAGTNTLGLAAPLPVE